MDHEQIIAEAEEILTRRYGGTQTLGEVQRLGGSGVASVFRARVSNNPFLQHRTVVVKYSPCLLYTSPSPRDATLSRMPSSA